MRGKSYIFVLCLLFTALLLAVGCQQDQGGKSSQSSAAVEDDANKPGLVITSMSGKVEIRKIKVVEEKIKEQASSSSSTNTNENKAAQENVDSQASSAESSSAEQPRTRKKIFYSGVRVARVGMKLKESHELRTIGTNSACDLQTPTGTVVRVSGDTTLRLAELYVDGKLNVEKTGLEMMLGKILVKARPLLKDDEFRVATKSAVCGVRGTEFVVSHDTNKGTDIAVNKGKVAVQRKIDVDLPNDLQDLQPAVTSNARAESEVEVGPNQSININEEENERIAAEMEGAVVPAARAIPPGTRRRVFFRRFRRRRLPRIIRRRRTRWRLRPRIRRRVPGRFRRDFRRFGRFKTRRRFIDRRFRDRLKPGFIRRHRRKYGTPRGRLGFRRRGRTFFRRRGRTFFRRQRFRRNQRRMRRDRRLQRRQGLRDRFQDRIRKRRDLRRQRRDRRRSRLERLRKHWRDRKNKRRRRRIRNRQGTRDDERLGPTRRPRRRTRRRSTRRTKRRQRRR